MSKISKKGRNPGAVDNWLDTLGLYRKNVAYDETCLFRAVSEQLFDCQFYHERVRKECISYARKNYEQFSNLVSSKTQWSEHLNKLEKHMVFCGDIELNIISKKYNRDVILFDASKQEIVDFTKMNLPSVFLLCLMDRDHFDVVYKREHIASAGFCQLYLIDKMQTISAIIYKILYQKVFKIPDVEEIVNSMLYDKNILTQGEVQIEENKELAESSESELTPLENVLSFECDEKTSTNIAPFPFKVAKALDPNIYRNIEYDSWGELRREMRLGEWYYGDDKLILGTKCIFNDIDTNEKFDCYIQEILKGQNKCVVFLTKVAEKKTVDYSSLSPENDAKPWPLPYRFMKNCVISGPNTSSPPVEKSALKTKRKYKDKKRTKSESSIISTNIQIKSDVENVEDYVGIPLQMQNLSNSPPYALTPQQDTPTEPQPDPAHAALQPDAACPAAPPRYQQPCEAAHWQPCLAPAPEQFVWPQSPGLTQGVFNFKPMVASAPVTPNVVPYHGFFIEDHNSSSMSASQAGLYIRVSKSYDYKIENLPYLAPAPEQFVWPQSPGLTQGVFNFKPMVASAPVTPNVVPYHDPNYPFYYNYHVEPYQTYPQWSSPPPFELQPPPPPKNEVEKVEAAKSQSVEQVGAAEQTAPQYCARNEMGTHAHERPPPLSFAPQSPSVEVYPQMMTLPPGTPVLYATTPHEMTEIVMPTTPIMYSPHMEMSYNPFIYPPTPPPSWYAAGVTSQGFFFPPRHT
ncbi:unnamed protein product [Phaedon cochleariae]|uniref:OTU domain-containing protein n=1 Tax=Phaedon cochleariae TaxID=80249 RepID=A0A9P0GU31_PHACE|nr:unnamed protein product [Phaedon cochleariae]